MKNKGSNQSLSQECKVGSRVYDARLSAGLRGPMKNNGVANDYPKEDFYPSFLKCELCDYTFFQFRFGYFFDILVQILVF